MTMYGTSFREAGDPSRGLPPYDYRIGDDGRPSNDIERIMAAIGRLHHEIQELREEVANMKESGTRSWWLRGWGKYR